MSFFHAIILSIVEGLTEFLPISSTGHLVLASDILKIAPTEFTKSFEIIIQLGAIMAVVVLYWQTLIKNKKIWPKIFIAFLPTALLGLIFYKIIKSILLENTAVVLISLLVGGIFLIIIEGIYKERKDALLKIDDLSLKNSFFIGLFQSISMIPGISRSASSIIGGMAVGLSREASVEFSFMLAIPTMIAATGLDIVKSSHSFTGHEFLLLGLGLFGSFVVALFAVKMFLQFVQKHSFIPFGIYRIFLALLFWLFIIRM